MMTRLLREHTVSPHPTSDVVSTVCHSEPANLAVPSTLRGAFGVACRALWLALVLLPPLLLALPAVLFPHSIRGYFDEALLHALERGGPCLTKLGQWASTRPDVLPLELCQLLSKLHSCVAPHPFAYTLATLRSAFDLPTEHIFRTIDERPLGSGSVAQVHRAELLDGQCVAIKVLHPGVEASVSTDLFLLAAFARLLECALPVHGIRWLSLSQAVEHFSEFMRSQLDLREEARNLETFISNFANEPAAAQVKFPQPLAGLVTRGVLVESFVRGEILSQLLLSAPAEAMGMAKLGRAADRVAGTVEGAGGAEVRRELARRGLHAFLSMLLRHNFVHADLHPGNILVDFGDPETGGSEQLQLAFVDAGLVVELGPRDRTNFTDLFRAIAQGDGDTAAALMLSRATAHECTDAEGFRSGMAALVHRARGGEEGTFFSLRSLRIGEVLLDVTQLVRHHGVKMDPNFATLVAAIVVLEGLGRQLDPSLDLFAAAMPMLFAEGSRVLISSAT